MSIISLNQLSHELLIQIFSHLTLEERNTLRRVCRLFNELCNEHLLWRRDLKIQFPGVSKMIPVESLHPQLMFFLLLLFRRMYEIKQHPKCLPFLLVGYYTHVRFASRFSALDHIP